MIFYYLGGAIVARMIYGRVRKAWIQYTGLKDLKKYGEQVGCPMVPGEDMETFRKRLIELRNKNISNK